MQDLLIACEYDFEERDKLLLLNMQQIAERAEAIESENRRLKKAMNGNSIRNDQSKR